MRKLTPEHWRRLEEIYHAALARGGSERTAFLAVACAGDEALRREVESLLDQPTSADGVLDGPALAIAARRLGEGADPDNQPTIAMLPTAVSPHVAPGDASRLVPGRGSGPIGSNDCSDVAAWVRCTRPSTSSTGAASP